MATTNEAQRAHRNINPHAEARLAMVIWSREYAHEQRGGCMDFWDGLSASRKAICASVVNDVLKALETAGRAPTQET